MDKARMCPILGYFQKATENGVRSSTYLGAKNCEIPVYNYMARVDG